MDIKQLVTNNVSSISFSLKAWTVFTLLIMFFPVQILSGLIVVHTSIRCIIVEGRLASSVLLRSFVPQVLLSLIVYDRRKHTKKTNEKLKYADSETMNMYSFAYFFFFKLIFFFLEYIGLKNIYTLKIF